MCTNIDIDFIDNTKVINARKHLNNSKLHLNLKGSVKYGMFLLNLLEVCFLIEIIKHEVQLCGIGKKLETGVA